MIGSRRAVLIRALVFGHDVVVAGLAYVVALVFSTGTWQMALEPHLLNVAIVLAAAASANWLVGLNTGVWRYASLSELVAIIKYAALTVIVFSCAGFLLSRLEATPRTAVGLTFVFMVVMTSASRISYRIMRTRRAIARSRPGRQTNTLLIGADDNAELYLKSLDQLDRIEYRPVGIIDDRNRRVGLSIHGVNVLSGIDGLERTIDQLNDKLDTPIAALVLTKARTQLSAEHFERIIEITSSRGLNFLRLPDLSGLLSIADERSVRPQPIKLEDLLSRPPNKLNAASLSSLARGASVLITGAGRLNWIGALPADSATRAPPDLSRRQLRISSVHDRAGAEAAREVDHRHGPYRRRPPPTGHSPSDHRSRGRSRPARRGSKACSPGRRAAARRPTDQCDRDPERRRRLRRRRCQGYGDDLDRQGRVGHGSAHALAANDAFEAHFPHQSLDRAAGHLVPFAQHLPPHLAHAVDLEVLVEHALDLRHEGGITLGTRRKPLGLPAADIVLIVGRRGDRQLLADRLDPVR